MPRPLIEKRCAWCEQTWKTSSPKARACSAACRAALAELETTTEPKPVPGFDFLADDDFVTTTEAASLLGTTRYFVCEWISAGTLRTPQGRSPGKGQVIQVRVGDVRRLLARRADGSGS